VFQPAADDATNATVASQGCRPSARPISKPIPTRSLLDRLRDEGIDPHEIAACVQVSFWPNA
jgi:hypothetical protein